MLLFVSHTPGLIFIEDYILLKIFVVCVVHTGCTITVCEISFVPSPSEAYVHIGKISSNIDCQLVACMVNTL